MEWCNLCLVCLFAIAQVQLENMKRMLEEFDLLTKEKRK